MTDRTHYEGCERDHLECALLALDKARAELAAAREDTERLDWMDRMNASLNKRYGTVYGWKLILNHNVVRLMRNAPSSAVVSDIDLNDMEPIRTGHTGCRAAIDAVRRMNE